MISIPPPAFATSAAAAGSLPPLPDGATLRLITGGSALGGRVWPAASVLCSYLLRNGLAAAAAAAPSGDRGGHRLRCIELGSGTGAVGIWFAAAAAAGLGGGGGCRVVLTEHRPPAEAVRPFVAYDSEGMPELTAPVSSSSSLSSIDCGKEPASCGSQQGDGSSDRPGDGRSDVLLDLLRANVDANADLFSEERRPPSVMELDWTDPAHSYAALDEFAPDGGFDLILASDVTYVSALHGALASTIRRLLRRVDSGSSGSGARGGQRGGAGGLEEGGRCLVAHQERLWNVRGVDLQLLAFERAAEAEGLRVTELEREERIEGGGGTVKVLELWHAW